MEISKLKKQVNVWNSAYHLAKRAKIELILDHNPTVQKNN